MVGIIVRPRMASPAHLLAGLPNGWPRGPGRLHPIRGPCATPPLKRSAQEMPLSVLPSPIPGRGIRILGLYQWLGAGIQALFHRQDRSQGPPAAYFTDRQAVEIRSPQSGAGCALARPTPRRIHPPSPPQTRHDQRRVLLAEQGPLEHEAHQGSSCPPPPQTDATSRAWRARPQGAKRC